MITRSIIGLVMAAFLSVGFGHAAQADTLEIAPAINKGIQLSAGEKKKGFIDISNPAASTSRVTLKVEAFKQTGEAGELTFYESEQVSAGIVLDLNNFELGARETIRVYYLLDGTKLPAGTVFAAIFAQNNPGDGAGVQSLRVGSLLTIANGSTAPTTATVASVSASFLQIGEGLSISSDIQNKSTDPGTTGVFPNITYSLWPYASSTVEGPLVFKGVTRSVEYRTPGNYVGLIRASVSAGENEKSVYVVAVTGFWRWVLPILTIIVLVIGTVIFKYRKKQ